MNLILNTSSELIGIRLLKKNKKAGVQIRRLTLYNKFNINRLNRNILFKINNKDIKLIINSIKWRCGFVNGKNILILSGESIAEINQIIQGHQDGDLTEAGFIQSKLLGGRLRFANFSQIISSDLNRAKQTTKEILLVRDDTPVEFDGRLREKAAGVFEGKKLFDYRKEAIKSGSLREFRPQGGESWIDVLERSREILNELIIKYVKKDYVEEININIKEDNQMEKSISNPKSTFKDQGNKLIKLNTITPMKVDNTLKKFKTTSVISSNTIFPIKRMNTILIEKDPLQIDYKSIDFDKLFKNEAYLKRMSKFYQGFDYDSNFSRILLVTHGGFIMEFLNLIRIRRNIRIKFLNDSKSSSLFILKIYCINCGYVCYSKDGNCRIEYDMILSNDLDHLKIE